MLVVLGVIKEIVKYVFYIFLILLLVVLAVIAYLWLTHEQNWYIERNAVKSETHPYAGFWKDENCNDNFGWAIGPIDESTYYVSFCGPNGCFKEGEYRPNTSLTNDPKYNIVDMNTIDFWSRSGWSTHVRCKPPHKKAFEPEAG